MKSTRTYSMIPVGYCFAVTYWNTTSTKTGTLGALLDESGAATVASITWTASGLWRTGEGNGSSDRKLSHAYLDDGLNSDGVSITVSDIPYPEYRVYILTASDQDNNYKHMDFKVNGTWALDSIINGGGDDSTTLVEAYRSVAEANGWVEILGDGAGNQTQKGNYFTLVTSGSTLTIEGQGAPSADNWYTDGPRGSITGLIIEPIPEPATALLGGLGLLALLRRRRG